MPLRLQHTEPAALGPLQLDEEHAPAGQHHQPVRIPDATRWAELIALTPETHNSVNEVTLYCTFANVHV